MCGAPVFHYGLARARALCRLEYVQVCLIWLRIKEGAQLAQRSARIIAPFFHNFCAKRARFLCRPNGYWNRVLYFRCSDHPPFSPRQPTPTLTSLPLPLLRSMGRTSTRRCIIIEWILWRRCWRRAATRRRGTRRGARPSHAPSSPRRPALNKPPPLLRRTGRRRSTALR